MITIHECQRTVVMRYLLRACVGMLILVVQSAVAREDEAKCPTLKFELRQVVSLQDLGRLAVDANSTKGGAGTIVFTPFDVEDRPSRDGARALGVIYARMGDLGETPVGGYLWMAGSTEAEVVDSVAVERDGKTASMTLTIRRHPPDCPAASSTFTLKPDGRFYVDGALKGTVR